VVQEEFYRKKDVKFCVSVYICSIVGTGSFSQGRERAETGLGSLSNREILPRYGNRRGSEIMHHLRAIAKKKVASSP